ncbi:NADP-dependent isocitrate dehydrogenase, partial [Helicobacter typhlonius]
AAFFKPIADELESKQDSIRAEFNGAQGAKVDLGGYYKFDDNKANAIMRPSKSFNAIIEQIARG